MFSMLEIIAIADLDLVTSFVGIRLEKRQGDHPSALEKLHLAPVYSRIVLMSLRT